MSISAHAAAAKMIRKALKDHGIKGRVTSKSYAGGNSVDVTIEDQAPWTVKAIREYVDQFQYGNFNGMTDSYEYSNSRDDIPQVKFAIVSANYSDELKQAAYDHLRERAAGYENHPESYTDAANLRGCSEWVSTEVHRVLCGSWDLGFWTKPRIRAAS